MGRRVWLGLVAAVWAAAIGAAAFDSDAFSTDAFSPDAFAFGDEPDVTVPDCTTAPLTGAACISAVEGEGLVAASDEGCSDSVADGDVIHTTPAAGASVPEGSIVYIRVSNGETCATTGGIAGMGVGF